MSNTATTCQIALHNPHAMLDFTVLTASNALPCGSRPQQSLKDFIATIQKRVGIRPDVQLFTLIYLIRLKQKLPKNARGAMDTPQRLFLAATLTSSKFLAESGTGLTSRILSKYVDTYSLNDINRMERSFLGLLRYDLWVSMSDVKAFASRYGHLLEVEVIEMPLPASPFQVDHCDDTKTDDLPSSVTTPLSSSTMTSPFPLTATKSTPHLHYHTISTAI